MAPDGVIQGAGGGDGGLFNGILARYLALVGQPAARGRTRGHVEARATAKELVLKSAQSAWDNRQTVDGLPLFAAFWDRTAEMPKAGGKEPQFVEGAVNASEIPERDMSVQLSGWMLMEAAHTVADETPAGQLVLDVPETPTEEEGAQ